MHKRMLAVALFCLASNFARGAYYDMELSETASSHRSTVRSGYNYGKPQITWSPALNGEGVKTGTRVYRVLGAQSPARPFAEVPTGSESSCSFFTVSVEMQ